MLWDFVWSFLGFFARIITVPNPFTSAALLLGYTHLLFPLPWSLFSTQSGWSVCTPRRLSMLAHGSIEYVPKKKLVIHSLLHHLYLLLALEMWRKGKFDIKTTEWDFGEFCWYPGFSHLVGIFFSHVGLVPSFINKRFRLNDSRNNYPEKPSSSSNFAIVACQAPLSMAFPGKNTGVGFHFLFQGILLTQRSNPRLLHWQGVLYHWATRGSH